MDDTSTIYADAFLGIKNIKLLGIKLSDIGKTWKWELLDFDKTVIPKKSFFVHKLK